MRGELRFLFAARISGSRADSEGRGLEEGSKNDCQDPRGLCGKCKCNAVPSVGPKLDR